MKEYSEVIKAFIFVTLVVVGVILASGLVSFEETWGKTLLTGEALGATIYAVWYGISRIRHEKYVSAQHDIRRVHRRKKGRK